MITSHHLHLPIESNQEEVRVNRGLVSCELQKMRVVRAQYYQHHHEEYMYRRRCYPEMRAQDSDEGINEMMFSQNS